jgi:amino acid permease
MAATWAGCLTYAVALVATMPTDPAALFDWTTRALAGWAVAITWVIACFVAYRFATRIRVDVLDEDC